MSVREVRDWLDSLDDDDEIGLAEDFMGLTLRGDPKVWIETGMAE